MFNTILLRARLIFQIPRLCQCRLTNIVRCPPTQVNERRLHLLPSESRHTFAIFLFDRTRTLSSSSISSRQLMIHSLDVTHDLTFFSFVRVPFWNYISHALLITRVRVNRNSRALLFVRQFVFDTKTKNATPSNYNSPSARRDAL